MVNVLESSSIFVHFKDLASRRSYLSPGSYCGNGGSGSVVSGPISASQRRGRFIVLGSSGECLPVSRRLLPNDNSSVYSSCDSESEEYHSAKASFDNGKKQNNDSGCIHYFFLNPFTFRQ